MAKKTLTLLEQLEADGKIIRASEMKPIEFVPTGFAMYDTMTHGGFRRGTWNIVWGPEGAGKSTFCYRFIAKRQQEIAESDRPERFAAIANIENAFDPVWAAAQGVDLEKLWIVPITDTLEQSMDAVLEVLATKLCDVMVMDSVHGLATQQEITIGKGDKAKDRTMKDDTVASLPRKMTQFMRVATPRVARYQTIFIIIGQARDKIDDYGGMNMTGGHMLKHMSRHTTRFTKTFAAEFTPKKKVKDANGKTKEMKVGFGMRVQIDKIMGANEGKSFVIPFLYGIGPDERSSNINIAVTTGVVLETSKSRYQWTDQGNELQKIHGRQSLVDYFASNELEYDRLLKVMAGGEFQEEGGDHAQPASDNNGGALAGS